MKLLQLIFCFLSMTPVTAQLVGKSLSDQKKAVVYIECMRGENLVTGTGFFIDSDKMVTCSHVIQNSTKMRISAIAQNKTFSFDTVMNEDDGNDLAIIRVSEKSPYFFSLSDSEPTPGTMISLLGFPNDRQYVKTIGEVKVCNRDAFSLPMEVIVSAAASLGSSGSPVIDEKGTVVGVERAIDEDNRDITFCTPSNVVRYLLENPFTYYMEENCTFNNDPRDLQTLGTITTTDDTKQTFREVSVGDTVTFSIYYHNTSDVDAKNVHICMRIRLWGNRAICAASIFADNSVETVMDIAGISVKNMGTNTFAGLRLIGYSWFEQDLGENTELPLLNEFSQSWSNLVETKGIVLPLVPAQSQSEGGNKFLYQGCIKAGYVVTSN